MTTMLTEKDSIRLLSDAYVNGYPSLLEKLGIDLIGMYRGAYSDTERAMPELLNGKSITDFSHIWEPYFHSFSFSVGSAILKVAMGSSQDLRQVESQFINVASLHKKAPVKCISKMENGSALIFASAYLPGATKENIAESVDPDIEESLELFNITRALGKDDTNRLGISYFCAKIKFPNPRNEESAVFFTENEAEMFLAKKIAGHDPEMRISYEKTMHLDRVSKKEFMDFRLFHPNGTKRTNREILEHWNKNRVIESPYYTNRPAVDQAMACYADIKTFTL